MTEPLSDVLRRWWTDTLTILEADPEAVEIARLQALERMDLDLTGRRALTDQLEAEFRDTQARAAELRALLGRGSDA
jgi:hypothetical protein